MSKPNLSDTVNFLDSTLNIELYGGPLKKTPNGADFGWNGLQVQRYSEKPIQKVGLSVDSGFSVLQETIKRGCDLLVVHHGLFWGISSPCITGSTGEKIQLLLNNNCALYAAHLPLDGHIELGNAAQIAKAIGLKELKRAFGGDPSKEGPTAGVTGMLEQATPKEDFIKTVTDIVVPTKNPGLICNLLFGEKNIQKIGIATGSASSMLAEAKALGCDLFISGEPKHEAYHLAKELKINAIFLGHYNTEVFGVRAIGALLEKNYGVATTVIDEPSGI